jgi:glycosyltransferase involved in cell wall biosynthesis
MGTARNYGIRMSQGRYITFLDSDDFYLRRKLQSQVNELDSQPALDATFCTAWHFRTDRPDWVGVKRSELQPISLQGFLAGRNHNLNTMCMRREVCESGLLFGEGDRGKYGEEWRLQLAMARQGVRMSFHAIPLVVVELRTDSHTTWARQWIMKDQAITEIEHAASLLTSEQRSTVDVNGIIDQQRTKLVFALLLDGRKSQAREVARLINGYKHRLAALSVATLFRYAPSHLVSALLRRFWTWRQNRSFLWQTKPPPLEEEFKFVMQ